MPDLVPLPNPVLSVSPNPKLPSNPLDPKPEPRALQNTGSEVKPGRDVKAVIEARQLPTNDSSRTTSCATSLYGLRSGEPHTDFNCMVGKMVASGFETSASTAADALRHFRCMTSQLRRTRSCEDLAIDSGLLHIFLLEM